MSKFIVTGGRKLEGKIKLAGNKNSALKIIPATLLGNQKSVLTNVPGIVDVDVALELIAKLGAKVVRGGDTVEIDPTGLNSHEPDPTLSSKYRASVVLAAPLLVKFGKAVITPPGGDQIGERLLDTHFSMLRSFGVEIERHDGRYFLEWKNKIAKDVFLEESSVTATEMGMMMASAMDSSIKIDDAAKEPHVSDLAEYLVKIGAKIDGIGTNSLSVTGGNLGGAEHKIVADHIEAGTFAIASAITKGTIEIENFDFETCHSMASYLKDMGIKFRKNGENVIIEPSELIATRRKFQTRPWPGFPTDLMSPFIVLATQTKGTVLCHDWMYEWRMFFVDDLISMGANIFIADPHRVIISGPTPLVSDRLFCKDIRAGMSVILAALIANGRSEIENIEVVERGYENIESRLRSLGAELKRE